MRTWSGYRKNVLGGYSPGSGGPGQAPVSEPSGISCDHACFRDGVLKLLVGAASLKSSWPDKPSLAVGRVSLHCPPNIGWPYKHGKNKEGNSVTYFDFLEKQRALVWSQIVCVGGGYGCSPMQVRAEAKGCVRMLSSMALYFTFLR